MQSFRQRDLLLPGERRHLGQLRHRPGQRGHAREEFRLGERDVAAEGEGIGGIVGAQIDVFLEPEHGRGEGPHMC